MRRHADCAGKEALGCFVMLLLAGFMALGAMGLVLRGIGALLRGHDAGGWRSILITVATWELAPAAGIALVAWLTCGLKRGR
ncbi:MAG TPA: hypothetical protein VFF52_18255 [Isosphaeraceae bacterium]|nr:hypothetical protein [Isosphaeraceae bacterium]